MENTIFLFENICLMSKFLISLLDLTGSAVTLFTNSNTETFISVSFIKKLIFSEAGFIKEQWKGALTGKKIDLFLLLAKIVFIS